MKLAVVTHCYNPPGMEHYSRMLLWQWNTLADEVRNDDSKSLFIEHFVCYSTSDETTQTVVKLLASRPIPRFRFIPVEMPESRLFRRAIGRNQVAVEQDADVVWFADVDYFVGPGAVRSAIEGVGSYGGLSYPSTINISVDHATGDEMLASKWPGEIDPALFAERRMRKAIGGVQFVRGEVARKVGYIPDSRYQREVDPSGGFRSCRCDVPFRRSFGKQVRRVAMPGIYRIRHTVDGRDYDQSGIKGEGRTNW